MLYPLFMLISFRGIWKVGIYMLYPLFMLISFRGIWKVGMYMLYPLFMFERSNEQRDVLLS